MKDARTLHLAPDCTLTNRAILDDPRVASLLQLLNQEGQEARIVGGAVRNALIGLAPGDIDITTTASPDDVTRRAKAKRLRVIPTGIAHGTVTIVVGGMPFEVTTLREDVETDGRHAVVRFGRDFVQDARRRDFTINGLSVDAAGLVHDVTGGLADLAARHVRFIGDPATRIREDYLRVLRFFRFSATYAAGPLDREGLTACGEAVGGLARLSRERIRMEVLKTLASPRAGPVVSAMAETGVLSAVLGAPCWPERLSRLAAIDQASGREPDAPRALAALGLRTQGDAARLRERLRLSNEERDRLIRIVDVSEARENRRAPPHALDILHLLFSVGRQSAVDAVVLWHVDSDASPESEAWRLAAERAATAAIPVLPMSGVDVLARGLRAGPHVGAVLKAFQARWIRAGFPDAPAHIHELLDDAVQAVRNGLP